MVDYLRADDGKSQERGRHLVPDTYTFDAALLPRFTEEISKLAKVAVKLSVPPITFSVIGTETREVPVTRLFTDALGAYALPTLNADGTPKTVTIEYVTVETLGESPALPGGWTFLGAIEHLEECNLVHGTSELLAQFRDSAPTCDHCGKVRDRKKTLVLRAEDGTLTRVGSACLKDFLGYHGNPERILAMLNAFREFVDSCEDEDGENYRGMRADFGTPTETFLTAVCATVRAHGWVPKSAYSGMPTAELVQYVLGERRLGRDDDDIRAMLESIDATAEDETEARAVIVWARTIPADTDNNYLGNVRACLTSSYVLARHYGIAASAVQARAKDEARTLLRAVQEGKRAASEFVGTVGQRLETEITVTFVTAYENDYGTTYLVQMEDGDGNSVKTFSSGRFGRDASKGKTYRIRGTVKAHEEYKGTKATMLARVAAL